MPTTSSDWMYELVQLRSWILGDMILQQLHVHDITLLLYSIVLCEWVLAFKILIKLSLSDSPFDLHYFTYTYVHVCVLGVQWII